MIAPVSTLASASVPVDLARAARSGSDAAGRPSPSDVAKAARQFEAILVRQLLAPSIEPLMNGASLGGSAGSGQGGGVYGYLLTDTLAGSISQGGGLGLASVITRQLAPASSVSALSDLPDPT
jgi:peptidoglycan hydrolase FlgJ